MSKEKFSIYGDATIDFRTQIPEGVSFGEDSIFSSKIEIVPAGDAGTMAQQLARLGQEVAFIGNVGDDFFGDIIEFKFRDLGIDTEKIQRQKGETGKNMVLKYPNRRRGIIYDTGVHTSTEGLTLEATDFIYVPFFPCYIDLIKNLHDKRIELGKKNQTRITTDLGFQETPVEVWDALAKVKGTIDICNISGEHFSLRERRLVEMGLQQNEVNIGIITLGEEGVLLVTKDAVDSFPAYKVENVVDTCGAGNSFFCGFLTKMSENEDLDKAVMYGQATAALRIQKDNYLPTKEDVDGFLIMKQQVPRKGWDVRYNQ